MSCPSIYRTLGPLSIDEDSEEVKPIAQPEEKTTQPILDRSTSVFSRESRHISIRLPDDLVARKREVNRQRVRSEINSTEQTYVESLFKCIHIFFKPIQAKPQKYDLTPQHVTVMFSNLESIANFHTAFFRELTVTTSAGIVILKYADALEMYSTYLGNYNDMISMFSEQQKNKKFSKFLSVKTKETNMDVLSYLIMPIQRIPRYAMLLRELIKYTPIDNPEYTKLQQALKKIERIAKLVNEAKRGDMAKLMTIQKKITGKFNVVLPTRKFIRDGVLLKTKSNSRRISSKSNIRFFYLFNDVIMWTTTSKKYRGHVAFAGYQVMPYVTTKSKKKMYGFELLPPKTKSRTKKKEKKGQQTYLKIIASEESVSIEWVAAMQNAISALENTCDEKKFNNFSGPKNPAIQRIVAINS